MNDLVLAYTSVADQSLQRARDISKCIDDRVDMPLQRDIGLALILLNRESTAEFTASHFRDGERYTMLLVRTTVRHPRPLQHDAHRDAATTHARRQTVLVINDVLARTLDVNLQARRLRWHATGPSFAALREMLRQMATDLDSYSDLTAQRAVLLGGIVDAHVDARQGLDAPSPQGAREHGPFMTAALGLLTLAVSSAATQTKHDMHDLAALGDPVSEHVLHEVASGLEKWTWCLEVHLQGLSD